MSLITTINTYVSNQSETSRNCVLVVSQVREQSPIAMCDPIAMVRPLAKFRGYRCYTDLGVIAKLRSQSHSSRRPIANRCM